MTEYLVYKVERFRPEGGNHVCNQVKYFCENVSPLETISLRDEVIKQQTHPYTDDNPCRLFRKIASIYKQGDKIRTIPESGIVDTFEGEQVELKEPLSHDELRILSIQVLEVLRALKGK